MKARGKNAMRKNIKSDIIQTAKQMFNERGYERVSTYDISSALGISQGNLNYHFKRKEDILEAVVGEMYSHYVKPETPATLEELNEKFLRFQSFANENAFYFWHFTQVAEMAEHITKIQAQIMDDSHAIFTGAFQLLRENGNLRNEAYPGQYEQIIQVLMMTCIYWIPHSQLTQNIGSKQDFLDCIWGVIFPLLTEAGKNRYYAIKEGAVAGM